MLFYDDGCRFCRACAALIGRLDRAERLAIIPLSYREAVRQLSHLTPDERMASIHLVESPGHVASAGDAVLRLCEHVPATAWLPRVARRVPPVEAAVRRIYRAIAERRSSLGCLVPDVPAIVRPPKR